MQAIKPRTARPARKCNCDDSHPPNGTRAGAHVALWTCPQHGNVFDDIPLSIVLTDVQRNVLKTLSDEHKAGRQAGVDEVSKILNYSTWSTRRAFDILISLNFIEPS